MCEEPEPKTTSYACVSVNNACVDWRNGPGYLLPVLLSSIWRQPVPEGLLLLRFINLYLNNKRYEVCILTSVRELSAHALFFYLHQHSWGFELRLPCRDDRQYLYWHMRGEEISTWSARRNWYVIFLFYSLWPIILFANVDVFRHILVIDTSVLAKSNMGRREYLFWFLSIFGLPMIDASYNIDKFVSKIWTFLAPKWTWLCIYQWSFK
jgi:hypothetical protein